MPNGWGVHFWMTSPRTLFVRFTRRRGRRFTAAVFSRRILRRQWQYVGATYDFRKKTAKLFISRRFVARKRIGRIRLATNYPVRMGARIGDRRYFRGRISCMQVYDQALTTSQILRRKKRCFTRGNGLIQMTFLSLICTLCFIRISTSFCGGTIKNMNSRLCHCIAQHLFPVFLWSLQFDENASHQEKVWDENRGLYHELLLCPS